MESNLLVAVQEWLAQYGLRLLGAIAFFIVGRWVAGWLTRLARRGMERSNVDRTLSNFAGSLINYGLLAIVIIAALNLIGFQTTSIVAVLGAATLAVGLALQDSLGNFAAGVMIILFRQYRVGDLVEIAGAFGRVKAVQIFNTTLTTPDNREVIVPNGTVLAGNIVNYSTNGTRRIDMVFGIGYEDDLLRAKELLLEILTAHPAVLEDPPPTVSVLELGDSSVNFAVRPHVAVDDYWDVHFYMHEQVKLRFDEAGISIPFPQRDVHLYQANGGG